MGGILSVYRNYKTFSNYVFQICHEQFFRFFCVGKKSMKTGKNKSDRGFVPKGQEIGYADSTIDQLFDLLVSPKAFERTIGARILASRLEFRSVDNLLLTLEREQKLYCKIEICRALAFFGKYSVTGLIQRLGKIGNNRHKKVSTKSFDKNSYPLPRDIAARTLVKIGPIALPELCDVLIEANYFRISEAIDTIGFICRDGFHDHYLEKLMSCFVIWKTNDLLRWKLFRAMSVFPASLPFLLEQMSIESNIYIKQEIERSICLLKIKLKE